MNQLGSMRLFGRTVPALRIAAAFLGLVLPLSGQTHLCVQPTSSSMGTFSQIQNAINTVLADPLGGSVTVKPGIYTPGAVSGITIPSPTTIPHPPFVLEGGGSYPSETVLDGQTANLPVIYVAPGWNTGMAILNFRIQDGGNFHDGPGGSIGGGISVDGSSPQIVGNEILCNEALSGGGIGCDNGASPFIADNLVSMNTAKVSGGGLYFGNGGGAEVKGNIISGNNAPHGGGLYALLAGPFLWQNVIEGNQGFSSGGGYGCFGATNQVLFANLIRQNHTFGNGAGALIASSQVSAYSNVFSENTAVTDGGGLFIVDSELLLMHQTIRANSADSGDGMAAFGSTVSLFNSIVWGNPVPPVFPAVSDEIDGPMQQFTVRNCDIGESAWVQLDPNPPASFNQDPLWVPSATSGPLDHHLQWGSSCRDKGLVDGIHPNGEGDMDLDPRLPQCAMGDLGPDIGADEFFTSLYVENDQTGSYTNAELISGSTVQVRIIGRPGFVPFLGGSSALAGPASFPYCNTAWFLDPNAPGAFLVELPPIPTSGLLDIPWTVPPAAAIFAMQVATLDPSPPHAVIATGIEPFLFLPVSETHPQSCKELENLRSVPLARQ